MTPCSALNAQVVQTTGNFHDRIRKSVRRVAKLVFGHTTDLDSGNRMLHSYPDSGKLTVVAFLARLQFLILRLFFGCKLCPTRG